MTCLGLVGKDISHSKSPEMYKKLLKKDLTYHLFDYLNSSEIKRLPDLFNEYQLDGLSITAPYKRHFIPEVSIDNKLVNELGIINCIKKTTSGFSATNTDLLACDLILDRFFEKNEFSDVLLLGGGAMSEVLKVLFMSKKISFSQFTRKKDGALEELDLSAFKNPLLINGCSRSFVFRGHVNPETIFWDLNYELEHHKNYWSEKVEYVDGLEMLLLQADFALQYWSIGSLS